MAVPKRKVSPSRRNMRRAGKGLKPVNLVCNATTGELFLSHRVSPDGYYKGMRVICNDAVDHEEDEDDE